MKIEQLKPYIQHYAWGHTQSLPEILSREPDGQPWAEMWMGIHPKGPAQIVGENTGDISLEQYIAQSPEHIIGPQCNSFNNSLPFLFKILAVAKPLSIQCHPTKQEAEKGFVRENRAGIPLDAFNRSYKDDNHKPEIICALTDYTALCGFRPSTQIVDLFSLMENKPIVTNLIQSLEDENKSESDRYKTFFTAILTMTGNDKTEFLTVLTETADRLQLENKEYRLIRKLMEYYPGDCSAAAPLYLNLIQLKPGEALYQPAGELHAYIQGTGVELMANSDNVLRGGLTPKFIDTDELMNIVVYQGAIKEKTAPQKRGNGLITYPTPTNEFVLSRVVPNSSVNRACFSSIQVLLCTSGTCAVSSRNQQLTLKKGEVYVVPAITGSFRIDTDEVGEIFIASIPDSGRNGEEAQ